MFEEQRWVWRRCFFEYLVSFITYSVAHTIIIHYLADETTSQQHLSGNDGGGGGMAGESKQIVYSIVDTVMTSADKYRFLRQTKVMAHHQ